MVQSRYFLALAIGIALWCSAFLGFTWLVDPYGVSPIRRTWNGINKYKPKRLDIDRLIKPYEVWRYKPHTVFLGTSRILQAIDPSVLDGTAYAPAYNASIPASSLGLNISHLRQYVQLNPKLRTVVVELFLYNFLGQGQERAPKSFVEYLHNTATLLISGDAFWASIQTIWHNRVKNKPVYEIKPGGYFYYPPGHQAKGPFDGYPAGIWQLHETRADGMKLHEPAFEAVRELVKVSREHDLNMLFILTPNHAYDDYYIESIGAWETVSEWLRRLSSEAVLYSFSQPNAWVYEPVRETMTYWNDPYHFSLEMGRAMQAALAGLKSVPMPENFIVRLTPELVPEHIESRRKAIQRWAKENPDFVAKFEEERRKWEAARAAKQNKQAAFRQSG